jgi:hypothetical protein
MKFNIRKRVGLVLVLVGLFLTLNAFSGITGLVVSESFGELGGIVPGIVVLVVGFFLFMSGLETTVAVYEEGKKEGADRYYLSDPEGLFGNVGTVGYGEFVKQCKEIRTDAELWDMTREVYLGPLIKIAGSGGKYSNVAERCLEALELEYHEEAESDSILTKEERADIKIAFKGWSGKLNARQNKVLKHYKLEFQEGKPHSKIISRKYSISMPASNSPSDGAHGGKNMANWLEKICVDVRRRDQEKV